jgi:hypothetical protein
MAGTSSRDERRVATTWSKKVEIEESNLVRIEHRPW